ncbi:Presenilin-domain-containing protein [Lichtheimia hyalospora FSU 10163]|nr:Presenilin-domain-containing protein [Lichtheimia hyalospora FSU 10163]
MSSLMAFSLTGLEEWTTWILLGLLAVWDLIAVLCPFGPLRLLIESSRNQQREVPALLYSVNAVWFMMATTEELAPLPHDEPGRKRAETQTSIQTINTSINTATDYDASTSSIVPLNAHAAAPATTTTTTTSRVDTQRDHVASSLSSSDIPNRREQERRNSNSSSATIASRHETSHNTEDRDEEDAERSGLKLGLGDFVFYSVLIARAALYDWITTVCCTIAVLMGLTTTIFLLAIYKKALPALPISIAFGILFYFVAKTVLVPYIGALCVFGMVGL